VRYRLTAAPMFVHCCHCDDCQKHTGTAFVINMLIETSRVELVSGDLTVVDMPANDEGSSSRIFRCAKCLVAVWSQYSSPRFRFVRAGTLDDPSAVTPHVHIYTAFKLPWVALPPSVPQFEAYYDPERLWPAESLERRRAALA
jgi:hypothetical protein